MRKSAPYLALIAALVAADQASKLLIVKNVALYESFQVIPGFFNITRIHNKGAIFGFFSQARNLAVFSLLTFVSFLAFSLVIYYFVKTPPSERLMKVSLSLILAGALGNLIDRIVRGAVVDFLDFYFGGWHWPSFNVADSCITVGAFLLIFVVFRRKPHVAHPH